jgi:hypothetical protein
MESHDDHASVHVRAGVTGRRGGRTDAATVDPASRTKPGRARRCIAALIVALAAGAGTLVAASPASASPTCQEYSPARWTTQQSYNFAPGGWCTTDGLSKVVFQSDGNLVWYDNANRVLFKSNTCVSCTWTPNTGVYKLSFQVDGNIVIYNTRGQALWAIGASSDRTASTVFYWQLGFIGGFADCFRLHHFQVNPDRNLHDWCL